MGTKLKKWEERRKKLKMEIYFEVSVNSHESVPKKQKATEGRICGKGRFY